MEKSRRETRRLGLLQVFFHLVELLLGDLASGIPLAEDFLGISIAVPVSPSPAPAHRPENQSAHQEQDDEDEQDTEGEEEPPAKDSGAVVSRHRCARMAVDCKHREERDHCNYHHCQNGPCEGPSVAGVLLAVSSLRFFAS